MSKPTALAAFASKQRIELGDGVSKADTSNLQAKNLAQVKVSPTKKLGDEHIGTNRKQLKELRPLERDNALASTTKSPRVLNELRTIGDGQGSSSRNLVGIASTSLEINAGVDSVPVEILASAPLRRQASLKPLAPTSNDISNTKVEGFEKEDDAVEATRASKTADVAATPNADASCSTQEEGNPNETATTDTKPTAGDDESDGDDFNFDDADGEKDDTKPKTEPEAHGETSSRFADAKCVGVDVEGLYDYPPDAIHDDTPPLQERQPKMFLPRASDIELFHVVLREDTDLLEQFLEEISPQEMLTIIDTTGRNIYHYAALSKSKEVQVLIFRHVNSYWDTCFELELKTLMKKKTQMSGFFLDNFKKLALHYAVENGNLRQVKWYFEMGVTLSQADVDMLFSFNIPRVMENIILRQLESIDIQNYHLPISTASIEENGNYCDAGVSTFVLAKLRRITDDSAGRLHRFPLHRAAMFGNIRAAELLLEEGADPSARDANQWTPLHVREYCADEASNNHLIIARLLMETSKPVDINARSLNGRSPLHIAVRSTKSKMSYNNDESQTSRSSCAKERLAFVAYLHECKAALDIKDTSGATPLLLACRGDDVGVTEFLLRAGCDPAARGDNKWNALHLAGIV
ncbi:unnamed protein product [Phytophthora fragariaefolia]|uniref:Unnamed protein product n=1 Tax=Phytophthora fragariaefolia TaxID=1490495 RepID=A0A9W6XUT7_9STRA|nr:unnamed protein product [Phytophthora fragariaefolia]